MRLKEQHIEALKYIITKKGSCDIDSDCKFCILNDTTQNDKYQTFLKIRCSYSTFQNKKEELTNEATRILNIVKLNLL